MTKFLKAFFISFIVFSFAGCGGGGGSSSSSNSTIENSSSSKIDSSSNSTLKAIITQTVSNAKITLNATSSKGNIAKYEWYENGKLLAKGKTYTIENFSNGKHTITLIVTDNTGATNSENTEVSINNTQSTTVTTNTNNSNSNGYNLRNIFLKEYSKFTTEVTSLNYTKYISSPPYVVSVYPEIVSTGNRTFTTKFENIGNETLDNGIETTKMYYFAKASEKDANSGQPDIKHYYYVDDGGVVVKIEEYDIKKDTVAGILEVNSTEPYDSMPTNAQIGDSGTLPNIYKWSNNTSSYTSYSKTDWKLTKESNKAFYIENRTTTYVYANTKKIIKYTKVTKKYEINKSGEILSTNNFSKSYTNDDEVSIAVELKTYDYEQ